MLRSKGIARGGKYKNISSIVWDVTTCQRILGEKSNCRRGPASREKILKKKGIRLRQSQVLGLSREGGKVNGGSLNPNRGGTEVRVRIEGPRNANICQRVDEEGGLLTVYCFPTNSF